MLVDTAALHARNANTNGLTDTHRAKTEKEAPKSEPVAEKPKAKAGRKPKAVAAEAKPVPKPAVEPTKIPASFPAKTKPVAKPKLEIKKEESVTDSGTEEELPVPKVKKVNPAAPTVAPSAPVTAPAAPAAPEKAKRAKFVKGSEEAKKHMADIRARRKAKADGAVAEPTA